MRIRRALLGVALAMLVAGCGDLFEGDATTAGTGNADEGQSCQSIDDCRPGLTCDGGICAATGTQSIGEACSVTRDCETGLFCAENRRCDETAGSPVGMLCDGPGDCVSSAFCGPQGLASLCQAHGIGGIGDSCSSPADCEPGLGCSASGFCASGVAIRAVAPFDAELDCQAAPEGAPFRVHFDIPEDALDEEGEPNGDLAVGGDFFALPFPNDARRNDGRIDLRGFPGRDGDEGDPVTRLISAIEEDATPFGRRQAVLFRFSRFPDAESIVTEGDNPTLSLVDIDPDSPRYGQRVSLGWTATNGGGNFICPNWAGLRPFWNQPLRAETTYAAIIRSDIRGPDGEEPIPDADFTAMLRGTQPEGERMAAAWQAYAPLRDYLVESGTAPTSVVAASVFTTGSGQVAQPGLARVAESGTPALASDVVACGTGLASPCVDRQGTPLTCTGDDTYWELHALVQMPTIQEGLAPFLRTGGGVLFDDDGNPLVWGDEPVCVVTTLPRGQTMPVAGWPLLVYAHDVGEGPQTHLPRIGVEVTSRGFATMSFEGLHHGARRGGTRVDPRVLFYNFRNPRALLGNQLQWALDILGVGHFAVDTTIAANTSPIGAEIRFDASSTVLLGQGQGASAAVIALADAHPFAAAVLSSAGGGWLNIFASKRAPLNIVGQLEEYLVDEALNDFEPYLNLLQMYLEPADPLNYAGAAFGEREEGLQATHVFQVYGLADSYTAGEAVESMARALELPLASSAPEPYTEETIDLPALGNVSVAGQSVTGVVVQYEPLAGDDGAFVLYEHPTARSQLMAFLDSLYLDGVPLVGTGVPVP